MILPILGKDLVLRGLLSTTNASYYLQGSIFLSACSASDL